MNKTTNIIIRVEEDVKNRFQLLAEENDTTMSSILNACMVDMVNRNLIPMNIRIKMNAIRIQEKPKLNIAMIKHYLEEAIKEADLEKKIKKAYLFGSYSRGEETGESDIDFRIEHTNHFDLFDLSELSFLLRQKTGKKVDIATQETSKMDPEFLSSIKKDEICIYERA